LDTSDPVDHSSITLLFTLWNLLSRYSRVDLHGVLIQFDEVGFIVEAIVAIAIIGGGWKHWALQGVTLSLQLVSDVLDILRMFWDIRDFIGVHRQNFIVIIGLHCILRGVDSRFWEGAEWMRIF